MEQQIKTLKEQIKKTNYKCGTYKGWNKRYKGLLASANAILELHGIEPIKISINNNIGHKYEDLIFDTYWDTIEEKEEL